MLQTLLSCMTEATKDCQPNDDKTNRFKMMYEKMKPVVEYFCVKNVDSKSRQSLCHSWGGYREEGAGWGGLKYSKTRAATGSI